MSSIDNRIVQMEFDNKQFEAGVQTTLKSLENLKNGLDLKGATNGIKNIEKAVSGFDMSSMGKAVDSIAQHFTWFGRTIDREIDRITSRAIAAGEQMIKSLSIDQVTVGWNKFEDKTRSVATIMNATGKSVDEVNKSLEKLNWFTDETSYNFTDMVNNVGKFTSVGVDLDDAVTAMQGIANAAALAGGGVGEASRAMYNFSQAMGTGKLLLQDWKSIELANMATTDFKQTLIQSGLAMKTLRKTEKGYITTTKDGTGAVAKFTDVNEGFRDSLSAGWITTEVMMDTFKKYGQYADEIYKITERDGITAAEAMEKFSDKSMLLGERAFKAAQEARTFTDAINATKDAVSTGWMQSFEIIFGNYEQAKTMWTDLANTLWNVFAGGAEARNDLLKETFQEAKGIISLEDWNKIADDLPFTNTLRKAILDTARDHGIAIDDVYSDEEAFIDLLSKGEITTDLFNEALTRTEGAATEAGSGTSDMTAKLKELEDVAKKVINGDFGNGDKRIEALTKAGYDYKEVQKVVNKLLNGQKIAYEDLSDEQSKSNDYTYEEINMLRVLRHEAEVSGTPLNELLTGLYKPTGRELMIEAASNSFKAFTKIVEAVKEAWKDVFPPMTSDGLYGIIEAIRDFTANLIISDDSAEKLKRGFEGLFYVLKIFVDVVKLALTNIKSLWDATRPFREQALNMFASLGDKIKNFYNDFKESGVFDAIANGMSRTFQNLSTKLMEVKTLISKALDTSGILGSIRSKWNDVKKWILSKGGIVGLVNTFFDVINGWITNIDVVKIGEALGKFVSKIKDGFKDVSGLKDFISKTFNAIIDFFKNFGKNSSESLSKGTSSIGDWIKNFIDKIKESFSGFSTKAGETFGTAKDAIGKGIEWIANVFTKGYDFLKDKIEPFMSLIRNILLLKTMSNINKLVDNVGKAFGSFSNVIESAADVVKSASTFLTDLGTGIKDVLEARAKEFKADAIIKIAAAIGILVAAVFVLTKLNPDEVYNALTFIGVLFAELAAGLWAFNEALGEGNAKGVKKISGFLGLALGIFVLVGVMKKLTKMDVTQVGVAMIEIGALLAILSEFSGKSSSDFKASNGGALLMMAISLQGFVLAMIELAKMKPETAVKGFVGLGILLTEIGLFTRLMAQKGLTMKGDKLKQTSGMVGLIGVAIALQGFVLAMVEIGKMNPETAVKGLVGLGALLFEVGVFTRLASKNIKFTNGAAMIAMGAAMLIFGQAMKQIGSLDFGTIVKGLVGMGVAMLEVSLATKSMSDMSWSSGIGTMLSMASLLVLIPLFKELSKIPDIEKIGVGFGAALAGIGIGMNALSKMGGIGGALSASGSLLVVSATIGIIIGIVDLIGWLLSKIPGIDTALENATRILSKVGEAFGALIGGITSGVMGGVGTGIEKIGTSLSNFWTNASGFVNGVKGLKAEDFAGIGELSTAVLKLTAAEFLDALTKLVGGGEKNLATFGNQLFALAPALSYFSRSTANVSKDSVQNAADALSAIANIQIPASGGFLQKMIGEKDFGNFGTQLNTLGPSLARFAAYTAGKDYSGVEAAATALGQLVSVDIPTVGGIVNAIVGRTDWGVFGTQLATFGPGFRTFADAVNGIQTTGLPEAAAALGELLKVDAPKNEWGIVQIFTGTTNWGTFGTQLKQFGIGFKGFATSMSGVTAESLSGVTPAVTAMKQLLELDIPKTDGFFQWLIGQKDLGDFGENLSTLGTGFGTFDTNIGNVNVSKLTSVVSLLERLGTFSRNISGSVIDDINNFSTAISMLDFSDVGMGNAISTLSEWTDDFATSGEGFANSLKDSFKTNIKMESADIKTEMDSIITAIGIYSSFFVTSGSTLGDAFIEGIKSKEGLSSNEGSQIAFVTIQAIRNGRASAVKSGQFIATGFIAGMNSKASDISNTAKGLADVANSAFQKRLRIKSPSKVMEENGVYFIEGFVRSVQNGSKNVESASQDMADAAVDPFSNVIGLLNGILDNTIDLQPTIRPVLDLTDIQSGAGQISSIFSQTQTIGLGGYQNPFIPNVLSQIGSNMNGGMGFGYVQNDNSDVIEAIRDLGNEFETIKDAISRMQIVMDTDALVGQIINKVDSQLGRINNLKSRGI